MLKSFRYLLIPISLLYGAVIWLRNFFYDKNILRSAAFKFPIICVGNLAVGGTGKTPMTEYLVRLLQQDFRLATISRGYKRKTKGFAIAHENSTALEIGDEPMQFHRKFPGITVAVGEERLVAIPQLLQDSPGTQVIILDDAFQHRQVRAGLNIVLTEWRNLFTRDLMLPAGDLRDVKSSIKRADIIVVTKCKEDLDTAERDKIIKEIDAREDQLVFFTTIIYSMPYHLFSKQTFNLQEMTEILLVCGIANPKPLKEFLTAKVHTYEMLCYRDHHIFNTDDLQTIQEHFTRIDSANKLILTTEKDGVRLQKFESELKEFPIYVLPIEHSFLFNGAGIFKEKVVSFINSFPVLTGEGQE